MAKKGKNKGGKQKLQNILIVYGVAAVFLILGIYGILLSDSSGGTDRHWK